LARPVHLQQRQARDLAGSGRTMGHNFRPPFNPMAILYTQIIKIPEQRILSGEFSPQSTVLKPSNEVIKELRNTVKSIPESRTTSLYTFESANNNFVFHLKINNNLVFGVISDRYTTVKLAAAYIGKVADSFGEIYTDDPKTTYYTFDQNIKDVSDKFNRDSSYAQGAAMADETRGILAESLNKIIKREESINNLKGLASRMTMEAQLMQKNVQRMRFRNMAKDYWLYVIVVVLLLLSIYYLTK
jgi:hypothetical protein